MKHIVAIILTVACIFAGETNTPINLNTVFTNVVAKVITTRETNQVTWNGPGANKEDHENTFTVSKVVRTLVGDKEMELSVKREDLYSFKIKITYLVVTNIFPPVVCELAPFEGGYWLTANGKIRYADLDIGSSGHRPDRISIYMNTNSVIEIKK